MRRVDRYIELLIISILTICLFSMCSNNVSNTTLIDKNEKEESAVNSIQEEIDRLEEPLEAVIKRDYRTNIIGNNEDVVTLMIYMCGSDLESKYGTASVDINEILSADISENVNILIETGGCLDWTNEQISEERTQIFLVENGELVLVNDDLGLRNMAEASTLTDFINYSKENHPANRYGLIIWNHGFGTLEGFGHDENFENDNMDLNTLSKALGDSNTYFDFIGFDACFMSTIEVANTLEPYSDYLIASPEIEPFAGWYYTNWINELSNNTSINTVDLGKIIVDDFVMHNSNREVPEKAMLTITDLTEVEYAYNEICNLLSEIDNQLEEGNYESLSAIRSESKTFSENLIDHIDILSLAENLNGTSSAGVIDAINECVKYSGSTSTMDEVGGLSLYFPYYKMNYFNKFNDNLESLDLSEEHFEFINNFANAVKEGKIQVIGEARKFEEDKEAEINRYSSN